MLLMQAVLRNGTPLGPIAVSKIAGSLVHNTTVGIAISQHQSPDWRIPALTTLELYAADQLWSTTHAQVVSASAPACGVKKNIMMLPMVMIIVVVMINVVFQCLVLQTTKMILMQVMR